MNELYINLYPIIKYGIIILAIFGGCFLLNNLINIVKDIIFKNNDTKITTNFIDKFPLVSVDFYKKTQKEQIAENNQEIHEVNKRLDKNDLEHKKIWQAIKILTELAKEGKDNG